MPGILLTALIAAWGGARRPQERHPAHHLGTPAAAGRALWHAKWELLLPVFVLLAILRGWATAVEASAIAAAYAFVTQCFVHRDPLLAPRRAGGAAQMRRAGGRCADHPRGRHGVLTSYLVDAMVPQQIVDWMETRVESKIVFLLLLNLFLLAVGCLMDIFSAIVSGGCP